MPKSQRRLAEPPPQPIATRPVRSFTDWDQVPLALNVSQVCDVSGLSRETVYALIRSGALPSKKIGRRRLITKAAARELVEAP